MELKVRETKVSDREEVNELATQLLQLHKKNLPNIFVKDKIEFTEDEFEDIVNSDDYYMVVAENEQKEVVAFAFMEVENQKEDIKLSRGKVACLSMIQVQKEYRRYGIGMELMKKVESKAKEKRDRGEVERIELRIWGFNSVSEQFSKNEKLKPLYTVYEVL